MTSRPEFETEAADVSPMRSSTTEFWEEHWAPRRLPVSVNLQRYPQSRHAGVIAEALNLAPGPGVLELGSGLCNWLCHLATEGCASFGLELSLAVAQLGRDNAELQGVRVRTACGDAAAVPFKAASFDAVLSFGLMEHFVDPVPALMECFRVLRPSGIVVTTVPNMFGIPGYVYRKCDAELYKEHVQFTPASLAEVHEEAGFRTVQYGFSGSFMVPQLSARRLVRTASGALNRVSWRLLSTVKATPESQRLSPEVIYVGRVPGGTK